MTDKEFLLLVETITKDETYRTLKHQRHHVKSNVYDHSLRVARLLHRHHKKHPSKNDPKALIRGALLHDYYLYDRKGRNRPRFHGASHPRLALSNALRKYPDLGKTERDMIRRHMFPLTLIPPKTRGGWLLWYYDKVAAMQEFFGKG